MTVSDGVDTFEDDNDFTAFHHVINELYPKQISKKVRQVKKKNASMGKFMGSQAPYGYKKSLEDKHQLIIDDPAAEVVKRIFTSYINGENGRSIAVALNNEGVPAPREYHYQQMGKLNPLNERTTWGSAAVMSILKNRVYTGDMVQGKRENISFKSKRRRQTSPDEWIIVENTHEPIIEHGIWLEVNKRIQSRYTTRTPKHDRPIASLTGVLFCADCGSAMAASLVGKRALLTYRCGRYVNHGKEICASHSIRADVIENIVLRDIRTYANIASHDREGFIKRILDALDIHTIEANTNVKEKIVEAEGKIRKIKHTVKNLYSDKVSGQLPEKMFYSMLSDYESELESWEEKLIQFREQLIEEKGREEKLSQWVDVVEKALDADELIRPMVLALIDRITVSDKLMNNGVMQQNVEISYKFAGCLDKLFAGKEKSID